MEGVLLVLIIIFLLYSCKSKSKRKVYYRHMPDTEPPTHRKHSKENKWFVYMKMVANNVKEWRMYENIDA